MPRLSENERNRALGMVDAIVRMNGVPIHFRCHPSAIITHVLGINHLNVTDWPPVPPDLAAIEHLWDFPGRRVYVLDVQVRPKDALSSKIRRPMASYHESVATCTRS